MNVIGVYLLSDCISPKEETHADIVNLEEKENSVGKVTRPISELITIVLLNGHCIKLPCKSISLYS